MPDASFTELPGRRVLVRRFGPQDVAEFVAYRSDAKVARYQSWDAPYPPEQGERFVAQMMTAHPDTPGEWFQFAVALRATGELVGDCAAMVRVDDLRQCEIGFTIAARYQGRGYATEAVRLLAGYLFARGKHRITACCDARNAASAAVLERLGMRREGHLRQSTWAKGEWTDDLLYAGCTTSGKPVEDETTRWRYHSRPGPQVLSRSVTMPGRGHVREPPMERWSRRPPSQGGAPC
jgi:RimJ/RimL family protein N-acetyltransferase